MKLLINSEFQHFWNEKSPVEYLEFEQNVLRDGAIFDPIITWNNTILDGHHRYEVAQKHGLDYQTKEIILDDDVAALEWIYAHQVEQRNPNAYERSVAALKLKDAIAKRAKNNQGKRTDILVNSPKSMPIDTRKYEYINWHV